MSRPCAGTSSSRSTRTWTRGSPCGRNLIGLFEFDGTGKLRLLTEYSDPTAFSAVT